MTNDYLTKDELAKLLRVTVRTITNYQRSPDFPSPVRVGRRNLWCRAGLIRYVRSRQADFKGIQ